MLISKALLSNVAEYEREKKKACVAHISLSLSLTHTHTYATTVVQGDKVSKVATKLLSNETISNQKHNLQQHSSLTMATANELEPRFFPSTKRNHHQIFVFITGKICVLLLFRQGFIVFA